MIYSHEPVLLSESLTNLLVDKKKLNEEEQLDMLLQTEKSTLDKVIDYIKTPFIVISLLIIFSIPKIDVFISKMLPQKLFYRALISESKQNNTIRGKNLQERSEIRNCLVR